MRADCDLDYAVEQLVDGSFFNSGQCCCAIERIYVHDSLFDEFVRKVVELTKVSPSPPLPPLLPLPLLFDLISS